MRTSQPLARPPLCLRSSSCTPARVFAPRFFQAPSRGECDFILALGSLPSRCEEDFHPPRVEHPRHTKQKRHERASCRPTQPSLLFFDCLRIIFGFRLASGPCLHLVPSQILVRQSLQITSQLFVRVL